MIIYKTQLSKKDRKLLIEILTDIVDVYSDFYITRDNIRLFLRDNSHLLFKYSRLGDKLFFGKEEGVAFVTGWSDNANRKYVKILSENNKGANKLLKIINWNIIDTELYCKIKKNNPLKDVLLKNGFRFFKSRGKEILYRRNKRNRELKKQGNDNANNSKE